MSWNVKYATFGQTTGLNDGTSLTDAWKTPTDMMNGVTAGDRVEMRQDPTTPYTHTSSMVITKNGTSTSPIWFRGYESTPGDGGMCNIIWTGGGAQDFRALGSFHIWENVSIRPGSTGENGCQAQLGSSFGTHRNLHLAGSGATTVAATAIRCVYIAPELASSGTRMILSGTNTHSTSVHECVFINDDPANGFNELVYHDMFGKHVSFTNCVFVNRTADTLAAFNTTRADDCRGMTWIGNIFVNFNVGITVNEQLVNNFNFSRISENVFVDMATYAVEEPGGPAGRIVANDNWYYNCTSGFSNLGDFAFRNTALTVNPLVDPINNDWRINNLTNGGAVIRSRSGKIDPLGIEPMEATTLGALLEPTGSTPSTHTYFG